MKLYPSNHKIKTVTETYVDTDLNIPLAYVNIDYTEYDIKKIVEDNFSTYEKRIIIPGEEFTNIRTKIFNKFEEEMNTENLLKRKGDNYVYSPTSIQEFYPKTFLYDITIKRQMEYKISNQYNLNISCIDDPDSLDLSDRLSKILTNPSQRNYLPPNIKVNNNKMSQFDFTDMTLEEADFVFIESPDGKRYSDTVDSELIDLNLFLNNNSCVWLASDYHEQFPYSNLGEFVDFKISFPLITTNDTISSDVYYDISSIEAMNGVIVHNPFNGHTAPVLILEYIGKGFVIYSHSNVLKNIEQNATLIYEMLMYCYLKTYDKTPLIKEWITYDLPDYEVKGNTLTKKNSFVSSFNISNYFGLKSYEYAIYNVGIYENNIDTKKHPVSNYDLTNTTNAIIYIGLNNSTNAMFELDKSITLSDYTELKKPDGWTSIYNNGKIFYLKTLHYLIENDITDSIYLTEDGLDLLVKIYPFKSSLNGINFLYDTNLTIPFIKAENEYISRIKEASYCIYFSQLSIKYCYKEDFEKQLDAILLFTIEVKQTPNAIKVYDMRQLGGGLPEDERDNYNLVDIGHINGRPYRVAGTLVIKLPKRYEKYKENILKVINTYKVAEDYSVLFFEDEEE